MLPMADDATRWLTPKEQQIWRDWLRVTERITSYLDAQLRDFDLDLSQYEILVILSETPVQRLRMSELAAQARQSRSRLTHTVARMEKKGLIHRETAEDDGRGVLASLTSTGHDLLVAAAPPHVDAVRHIFVDAVDPGDFTALGRALASVLAVAH